jgi:hypothetical protein
MRSYKSVERIQKVNQEEEFNTKYTKLMEKYQREKRIKYEYERFEEEKNI